MDAPSSGAAVARAPLIALALAGGALVLAAVTAVVVLRRDPASAAAPGDVRLVASRTSAATLAAAVAGTPLRLDGGRLVATDPAALGLAPGDLVRTIGGVPVESAAAGRAMLRRLTRATPEALLFEVERGGAIAVVRVTIDGDRAALTAPRDPDGATAPDLSPALPPAAPTDPDVAAILAGVTKVDDTHVVVTRAAVDQLLANPMAVAQGRPGGAVGAGRRRRRLQAVRDPRRVAVRGAGVRQRRHDPADQRPRADVGRSRARGLHQAARRAPPR
jgi:hypothetical protein